MSSLAHLTLSGNALLAALPQAALTNLQFSHLALPQGEVCFDAGDLIQRVYFPTTGLISLVVFSEKDELIEAGMIGREGAAGTARWANDFLFHALSSRFRGHFM